MTADAAKPPAQPPQPAPALPAEIFATLTGDVNADMVRRVFNAGSIAINAKVRKLHLLIQSTGGFIGDGIALHNYLKNIPVEITTYNMGSIMSIAVLVYLVGKVRNVSKTATFMVHKSTAALNMPAAGPDFLKATAESLLIDDARSEAILREHVNLPLEKWRVQERGPLTITAEESVQFGLAHTITDWVLPSGTDLATI
jgi:ATP-dependent Clp protease protease subunit